MIKVNNEFIETEFGYIPKKWKVFQLEDVVKSIIDYRGKTPKKTLRGVPLVTAKIVKNGRIDFTNLEYIAEDDFESWMTRGIPQAGDVVLTTEAPLGEVAQLPNFKIALAQRIITLSGKDGLLDNSYLKYYLGSDVGAGQLRSKESGSVVTGIKQSELRKINIVTPPISEQKQIVEILSSLDDKIELNRKINANLEKMVYALFKKMFVDTNDSTINKSVSLIEIIDVLSGGTPKTDKSSYWGTDISFFTPKDAHDSVYVFDTEKMLTNEGLYNCNSPLYPINTTFITARGTVGKVAMGGYPMAMNQSCYALKGKDGIGPFFVYELTKMIAQELREKGHGSVFETITVATFSQINIALPPIRSVLQFEENVVPFFDAIRANSQENHKLGLVRDLIMPRLLSGHIKT